MSQHNTRKPKIALAWVMIALATVSVGRVAWVIKESEMFTEISRGAARMAVAFAPDELQQLSARPEDAELPFHVGLKKRLGRFRTVDSRVRMATVVRFVPAAAGSEARFVVLFDSRDDGARELAPGSDYPLGSMTAGVQELLATGRPGHEPHFEDEDGKWVRGYGLVNAQAIGPGGTKDFLVLVVDAARWDQRLWLAALQGAFFAAMLLGGPFGAWLVMRRQGEQREVIRNLSEAMEQSHSAIMIVDLDMRVEYANRGLCQQIGYGRRELIGRKWKEVQVAEEATEAFSEMLATVRGGRSWEGEWLNKRKDGATYPAGGVVTPVKRRDGSIACFVAVFDDVTETKKREAELREARDLAQAGDRAKGQFLATMSHEVRTPLNGIVGFTSLLLDTELSAEQRDYVQTIKMSTEALIQLTGDILDFARIESGKLKLDPLACDPRECVEDALDLLAAKASEKGIELVHHVADNVPAAIITDGGRLRQVLVNLVGNAVKFTERGEIEVRVTVAKAEANPESTAPGALGECVLHFAVRDTGIGIAPEHHAKLFRPFTQADESTTRRYGGTGLGLAICRNLVELMGGEISVQSSPGRGSTFSFTIRSAVAALRPPLRKLPELRVGLAARPGALRRELTQLLRGWEAEVIEVDQPEDLAAREWDVAVVDVCEDVARDLAGNEPSAALASAKTIGLVPLTLPNDLRAALRAHFRLLVNRPVHHEAFFALLANAQPKAEVAAAPAHFGFRVLVVEDNAVNLRLVSRVLENLGCLPTLVDNGRKALEVLKLRAEDFDLVLLDLHMPELDGLSALREIRMGNAGSRAQTMWVIALTADAREEERARAMAAGLNDYLTKPLNIPALEAALRRFRQERTRRR